MKVGELIRALHDPWILPEEGPLLVAALDLLVRREVLLPNTTDSTGAVSTTLRVTNELSSGVRTYTRIATQSRLVLRAPSTLVLGNQSHVVPASGQLELPLSSLLQEGFVFAADGFKGERLFTVSNAQTRTALGAW